MKINKKGSTNPQSAFSNAETYAKNARDYCQRSGRADGTHPVISKDCPEWPLWMDYFRHIGHPHARLDSYADRIGRLTVPAYSPDEFEPGWAAAPPPPVRLPPPKNKDFSTSDMTEEEKIAARGRAQIMVDEFKKTVAATKLKFAGKTGTKTDF